ncbi:MAG: hypothetical protein OXP66_08205 [Candidatus Tectomicrobia bacterium]|nr:hypothetical protein [Candidatus Tectomicrobia bacterium]
MANATFDTLQAARALEAAGMDRKQAEAVAAQIRDGQGQLATKADTAALKWAVGILTALCLATFGIVVSNAYRLGDIADKISP